MKRREFIALIGVSAAWPAVAQAQQQLTLGLLSSSEMADWAIKTFRAGHVAQRWGDRPYGRGCVMSMRCWCRMAEVRRVEEQRRSGLTLRRAATGQVSTALPRSARLSSNERMTL